VYGGSWHINVQKNMQKKPQKNKNIENKMHKKVSTTVLLIVITFSGRFSTQPGLAIFTFHFFYFSLFQKKTFGDKWHVVLLLARRLS